MNYRRWLIVGYILVLMGVSASILLVPGEKYQTLTTSDSGWIYISACEIEELNGLPENNPISHAPYGLPFEREQLQPLAAVMLYRAVGSAVPGTGLMDIVRYWAPLIFALSLIPIFLIGRELGGDVAGAAAAFFATFMISTIYWNKVGAFDREPIQLILGSWAMLFLIKTFKAERRDVLRFALLSGMALGLYALAWTGWHHLLAVAMLGLLVVLVHEFLVKFIPRPKDFSGTIVRAIRNHLDVVIAFVCMGAVITAVGGAFLGRGVELWTGAIGTYLGYFGIGGGGGVSFPRYAGEAQAPSSLFQTAGDFYQNQAITAFVFFFIVLAILKFIWTRKRWELLVLSWLIVLTAMVWPNVGQARFERLGWAFVAVMGGVGVSVLVPILRRFWGDQLSSHMRRLLNPLAAVVLILIVALPFWSNAYYYAGRTTPPTEWRFVGLDAGFNDAFAWIRENTPEDSIFAVEWSFGHLLGGATHRRTVCDGAEVLREEGTWENDPSGPHPPDYIYYVDGNTARIYGINASRRSYAVNGRRTDVQWMPYMDPDEFRWLLRAYSENYGVRVDYVVFTYEQYYESYDYYNNIQPVNMLLGANRIKAPNQLRPTMQENNLYRFDFGENREYVMLDMTFQKVYLRTGGENLMMDGYALIVLDNSGRISSYGGFSFPSASAEVPETLLVFLDQSGNVVTAWLIEGCSARVHGRPVPVGLRAFMEQIDVMEYVRIAYTSQNGYVKVFEINHSPRLLSPSDGSTVSDNRPRLEWVGALSATNYRVLVDEDGDFSSPLVSEEVSGKAWITVPRELEPGTYHWKVVAVDDRGIETESQAWRFTVSSGGE
ncbi:MAG: STT3 domain-containing protein [Candidatus Hadarchaeales archaeon]